MLTVAVDARLTAGSSTGDSTYWTELLLQLSHLPDLRILAMFNATKNTKIPPSVASRPNLAFGGALEWVPVASKNGRWWSLVAFPLAVRRLRSTLAHVQYSASPLLGRSFVSTVHDVSFLVGPAWFKTKDKVLLQMGVSSAVRRAARVITVSDSSRQEIESWIPSAKGRVRRVYNACPSWVRRVDRTEAMHVVSSKFGIDEPFLLTVGTRWPRKNMVLAVAACEDLPAHLPHRLAITGKLGWGEEALRTRSIATGYVSEEDLCCLYSAADLYLAPSWHEGFGIPVLEAFRCGCPVICSSGGALPEVAGDAAIVLTSWQPSDWSATIERALRDPSNLDELRSRGFQRERAFSWRAAAQETLSVYREVLQ